MGDPSQILTFTLFSAGFAVLLWKHREVAEAIVEFRNNFPRGGPRTPMHPSPGFDEEVLRRRRGRR
jgi:hypothetical protein